MTPPGGAWNEMGQSESPAVELLKTLGNAYCRPKRWKPNATVCARSCSPRASTQRSSA